MMRRRKRNPFAKAGILCLSVIIALGVLNVGYAMWSESLTIDGSISTGEWFHEEDSTHGFWKNFNSHRSYTEEEIEAWLVIIDDNSLWLGPRDIAGMLVILNNNGPHYNKFILQYLPLRLGVESGRLDPSRLRDCSGLDPSNYLGLADNTASSLTEIISAIESKCGTLPSDYQFEIMKNVCEYIIKLWI